MALFPERLNPFAKKKEVVTEIPEEPAIPEALAERAGIKKVETAFTATVKDDKGQPLVQTPQAQTVAIQVPATQAQLTQTVKGSKDESLTWWAAFWLRMIKKAIHFGKQIIFDKLG